MLTKTFTSADPLKLVVNDLVTGRVTDVEFQVRPTNANHLWYAYNVLDWPQGDRQGQVQRDENNSTDTFYKLCLANGGSNCFPDL